MKKIKTFDQIKAYCQEHGGLTLNLRTGYIVNRSTGYFVSFDNGLVIDSSSFNLQVLSDFITDHLGQLLGPEKVFLGIWLDGDKVYIDRTVWVESLAKAYKMGLNNNQKAIFDCTFSDSLTLIQIN